jgi:hypothetical protein
MLPKIDESSPMEKCRIRKIVAVVSIDIVDVFDSALSADSTEPGFNTDASAKCFMPL